MSDESEKGELQSFLRKALEIQLERFESDLSQEELKSIAIRAGLTEDDWNRICSKLEAHLSRGRNFLQFKNAGDAIRELDQAAVLAPYRVDVLADCARAHHLNWEESDARESKNRATELYGKCLRIDPGHVEAAEGLSGLKSRIRETTQTEGSKRKVLTTAAIAALLMTGSGIFAWNGLTTNSGKNPSQGDQAAIHQTTPESIPDLSKEEFARWLQTKEFSFTGWLEVRLTFEADHVNWESKGRIWKHDYTIDSPGRITIHREEEFKIRVLEDLRSGDFESSKGKYVLTIRDLDT